MFDISARELLAIVLSVVVQLPLAIFLGHYFDQRIFLQTGYLVANGLNPYVSHVINAFSNPYLTGVNPIIGYPPVWPLLLGLIYDITYNLAPNLFLYNFATKIPIIASNIALAYITKIVMLKQNLPRQAVWFAFLFLLFNPFTLLTTTAWGEFDTLVALLCVGSMYLLSKGLTAQSSLLLALSFVLKPISLPLLGLPLFFSTPKNHQKNLIHVLIVVVVIALLWILPFNLLGWAMPNSANQLSSFVTMAGGMTPFNLLDVLHNSATMPQGLAVLGYLWIPALIIGYYFVYRYPPKTFLSLTGAAVFLLLVFFLSRSWLSEQNINLLLPFLLMLVGSAVISRRTFHFVWVIPLAFLVLNASIPQLFFLVSPEIISLKDAFDLQFGVLRLAGRFAVTIVWYIFAFLLMLNVARRARIPRDNKQNL